MIKRGEKRVKVSWDAKSNTFTAPTDLKKILRNYEQYYGKKSERLDEGHKFLEKHKLLKMTQEEIENLNMSRNESIIKRLPIKKNLSPNGFTGVTSQMFKKEKHPS